MNRLRTYAEITREFMNLGSIDDAKGVVTKSDAFYRDQPPPVDHQQFLPSPAAIHTAAGDTTVAFALLDCPKVAGTNEVLRQAIDARMLALMAGSLPITDRSSAKRTLDQIVRRFEDSKPKGSRSEIMGSIAEARARLGDSVRANPPKEVAAKPITSPYVPSKPIYTLANATMHVATIEAAMGDFETARKTASTITESFERGLAYTEIARLQAASGDAGGTLVWVRDLKEPNQGILQALIEGAAQAKTPVPAIKTSAMAPVRLGR